MTGQTRVTLTAGVATLLGALPLAGGFAQQRWFGYAAVAVAVVTVIGILLRRLRVPAAVIVVLQFLGLLVFHTATFASKAGYGGIVPNSRTLSELGTSLSDGLHDIQYLAAPVPARTDIVVLTSLAVGLLAIVVDFIAVSVQRPAVAGLALLALFAVATAVSARTLFFEFAGAGAGYLLLLAVEGRERLVRWGRVVTADDPAGADTEHYVVRTPRHGAAGRVGVAAVAAALIIPMLVPGFTRNVLSTIGHGSSGGGDGTQSLGSGLNPFTQLQGSLQESKSFPILSVKSKNKVEPWYLRVTVLDQYTPAGWRRSQATPRLGPVNSSMRVPDEVANLQREGRVRSIDATITIASYHDSRLPIYYAPTGVSSSSDKDWSYDTDSSEILSDKRTTTYGDKYTVTAAEPDPTPEQLEATRTLSARDSVMQRWGQEPVVKPLVASITRQITYGDKTPFERAQSIDDYFTNGTQGFSYSLQTKPGTSSDALSNFLQQKQGFCEQYASAMAVMLRLAKVPSRVVLGYAKGSYDDKSKSWKITNHDAHAWVEAYFDGIGWVEFDPTPRDDNHTSDPGWQQSTTSTETTAPSSSASSSVAPSGSAQQANPTQNQNPEAGGGGTTNGPGSSGSTTPARVGILLGVLALLIVLLLPATARYRYRRKRYALARGPSHSRAAHACWAEILDTMADLGIPLLPSESPRGTAARLAGDRDLDPTARTGLSIVALAEERARYAAEAGVDAYLPTALRAARTGLLSGAGTRRRIWIWISPPSILQSMMDAMSRGSARASSGISGLGRAFRPRNANR